LGEGQAAGHDQGTEELQRPHPFIAIGHLQHFPRGRRFRGGDALAGLNRGFLISADNEFALGLQGGSVLESSTGGASSMTADPSVCRD
jgi:hypothetical protein